MKQINENSSVWYSKYNPFCVEDMILPEKVKKSIQEMIASGKTKHIGMFSDTGGLGKSALCHAIIKEVDGEALWINASLNNGIDVVRSKIHQFATSSSIFDAPKIVIMDEFDNFSQDGQKAFRGFIDEFGDNCMFIVTGNYKDRIIEQLLTRLMVIDFQQFPKTEMVKPIYERLQFILTNENVTFEPKDVIDIMNTKYPSIRSMVVSLQEFTSVQDGKLKLEVDKSSLDSSSDYKTIMSLRTPSSYFNMVQEINKLASPDSMYTYMYNSASDWFKPENYPKAIVTIAKYQAMSSQVRNKNLNLAACLTELMSC